MKELVVSTSSLSPFLQKFSIDGPEFMDRLMNDFNAFGVATNYPPLNIQNLGSGRYLVEVALAGFEPKNIQVTTSEGYLTITAGTVDIEGDEDDIGYQHRGLAMRSFSRSLRLLDHIEVTSAKLRNGLLSITCERILPEALKPKVIAIDSGDGPAKTSIDSRTDSKKGK